MTDEFKRIIYPDDENPVDYYNRNHADDVFNILLSIKAMERNGPDSVTYVQNSYHRKIKMIIYKDGYFTAKHENGLNLDIGKKYTPFEMMQRFKFKNSFKAALYYVIYEKMNVEVPYIRVGVKYFKKISKVDRNGITRGELKVWDKPTIIEDYGKDFINKIPTFNDFTIEPSNTNYQETIGNHYNLYSPFEHTAATEDEYKGELDWYWTNNLLEHIFGEQYELGLQYISTLYTMPKQKLPILVLVSEERSTGKTTFIDWLDILFGDNTVIINPQDISNSFNGAYADKNIIMIEESKFDNRQALEKLKNLSTQKKMLVNTKFVPQYSIPFHGKLIITSNDENKFSKIDDTEIRYWIRKIPSLTGKANHNILNDMVKEIPYFLYYLSTLEPIDTTKSRMVFTPEALNTEALETVKKESRSWLYKDIEYLVESFFMNNQAMPYLRVAPSDIKNKSIFKNNHNVTLAFIRDVLKNEFRLMPSKPITYIPFEEDKPTYNANKMVGRVYTFKNPYFNEFRTEEEESEFYPI